MFVAIYRWRLHPGQEEVFREGWRRITELACGRCGSGGSALFRDRDGTWVAIARWPSREARERCFAGGSLDAEASALMRAATAAKLPDLELEGDTDLWRPLGEDVRHGRLLTRAGRRATLQQFIWRMRNHRTPDVAGLSEHMLRDIGLTREDGG